MSSLRIHRDLGGRSRGQAMAEFALVAPLLFILLIGIFEAGRFVLNLETLNNATREGARYAIVHGAQSSCPTGPMPPAQTKTCKEPGRTVEAADGDHVKEAVASAAVGLASLGKLTVHTPVWIEALSTTLPDGPDDDTIVAGNNYRGNYVSVFTDYTYDPIFKQIFDTDLIPSISMSAESTLVINH